MNNYYVVRKKEDILCKTEEISEHCLDLGHVNTFKGSDRTSNNSLRTFIESVSLPQIAIKKESNSEIMDELQIALVNGCWDTSDKIPNIVAEMHNVNTDELKFFQNTCKTVHKTDSSNPSPRSSDSGIEADCDGNLSWLLNYKINEILPVPDALDHGTSINDISERNDRSSLEYVNGANAQSAQNGESTEGTHAYRYSGPKKPPFTYTELIEHALSEKGELTVSGIYHWISEHFPFYKQNDDRWKNSVRHNLSINPHFRKGGKAIHGAGHLWTIAQKDFKKSWHIKQRMQQFIQLTNNDLKNQQKEALDMELEAATASILGDTFNDETVAQDIAPKTQNIEVEFINVVDVPNGLEDFLSPPVSKQQLVQECGLGNDFLITDLNPNSLGLNLTEAEVMTEEEMYNDISLEYYGLQKDAH